MSQNMSQTTMADTPRSTTNRGVPDMAWGRRLVRFGVALLVSCGLVGLTGAVASAAPASLPATASAHLVSSSGGDNPPSTQPPGTPGGSSTATAGGGNSRPDVSVGLLIAAAFILLVAIFFFLRASSRSRRAELEADRAEMMRQPTVTTTTTTVPNPPADPNDPRLQR